jgi:vacuolar-type H+-ATPase subunit H
MEVYMDERHTIDELVSILSDIISEAWAMPLSGGKVVIEKDRMLELINEIKSVMPGDIQQARAIVESRNELASAARRDADAIIRAAEDKARVLVNDSAILNEAKRAAKELLTAAASNAKQQIAEAENQARQITSGAEAHANELLRNSETRSRELKSATSKFVDDALSHSEEALSNALTELHRVKQQFRQVPPAPAPSQQQGR